MKTWVGIASAVEVIRTPEEEQIDPQRVLGGRLRHGVRVYRRGMRVGEVPKEFIMYRKRTNMVWRMFEGIDGHREVSGAELGPQ